jgi:hypothetical protein
MVPPRERQFLSLCVLWRISTVGKCVFQDLTVPIWKTLPIGMSWGCGSGLRHKEFYEELDYGKAVKYAVEDFKRYGSDYHQDFLRH